MALTFAFKRLLPRAALFLWISPLLTAESIMGWAVLKAAWAFSLSPVLTASMTFLMNVRRLLRCPALRIRLFSACFARFFACAVLAMCLFLYKVSYQTAHYLYKCYHCQHLTCHANRISQWASGFSKQPLSSAV